MSVTMAGSLVGWWGGQAVVAPGPDCLRPMRSLPQRPGVTFVRFGCVQPPRPA